MSAPAIFQDTEEIDSDAELELALPEVDGASSDGSPAKFTALLPETTGPTMAATVTGEATATPTSELVGAEVQSELPPTDDLNSTSTTHAVRASTSMLPPPFATTTFPPSGGSSSSSFRAPPNPSIPQDLSMIMEMVASHQVVGAMPPVSMTVAEKRRAVEASMAAAREKSKGKAKAVEQVEDDSSSAISSDDSSDDSSDEEDAMKGEPMTEDSHKVMKSELEKFLESSTGPPMEFMTDSEDEEEFEDGEFVFSNSPLPSPRQPKLDLAEIEDDDEGVVGPITSIHEVPLPPVVQPPIQKLPPGEGVSLAGDVISWMKEKKLEAWLKQQGPADLVKVGVDGGVDEETAVASGGEQQASLIDSNNTLVVVSTDVLGQAEQGEIVDNLTTSEGEGAVASTVEVRKEEMPPVPKFASAGTVVIRAMQSRPGSGEDGWLEEGSVVCWEDGRVLGAVRDAKSLSFMNTH
jgi:H/ACA ribonucleoprotein complex non-core subunit NAF1